MLQHLVPGASPLTLIATVILVPVIILQAYLLGTVQALEGIFKAALYDYASGQQAATLILAALLRREKQGVGCHIDTSIFETVLSWQSFGQAGVGRAGRQLEPGHGLITGGVACYQIYRTADDRFVVLGALEEKFWQAFCTTVGHPEWVGRQHEPLPQTALINEVRAVLLTASRDSWVERLAGADCCFEPLLDPEEVAGQPQVMARRLLEPSPGVALPTDVRMPAKVDGRIPRRRRALLEVSAEELVAAWRR